MESKLITANTWFGSMSNRPDKKIHFHDFRQGLLHKLRRRFNIPETGFDEELEPVPAFVNRGAWLVMCPKCNGAEYAWEQGYFFCCSCLNSYMGHKYRRLVFPNHWKEIEALLAVRPLENRHWNNPHFKIKMGRDETLGDLKRENEEHAVELLVVAEGGK